MKDEKINKVNSEIVKKNEVFWINFFKRLNF